MGDEFSLIPEEHLMKNDQLALFLRLHKQVGPKMKRPPKSMLDEGIDKRNGALIQAFKSHRDTGINHENPLISPS